MDSTRRKDVYEVDHCYEQNEGMDLIFSREIKPLIPDVLNGKKATFIGFGARGSGKTYAIQGFKQVLVKLGAKGSALFCEGEEPIKQPIIAAPKVLDTTGASDTFTAAYAVALVEGKPRKECLRFAAAAASLCVQVKGAIPSMPDRKSVLDLLQSL